jgi:hypothetical protein
MAPFTAANGGRLSSHSEDVVNQILSILAAVVAMSGVVLSAIRLGVRGWIANVAAVAGVFGTGLFHYATYDSSFAHVYSAALVSLLMTFGVFRVLRPSPSAPGRRVADGVFLFLAAGLLIAIRLQSLLVLAALVVVALAAVWRDKAALRRWVLLFAVSIGPAVVAVLAFQLFYDHYTLGRWTLSSYAGQHFYPGRLKELPVLAGFKKGFLTNYPVALVAVIAAAVARRWRGLLVLAGLTLPLAVLYGSWWSWYLSGGFGHRGFVEIVPAFALVLAYSLERLSGRARAAMMALTTAGTVMCLGLLAAYWERAVSYDGVTPGQWITYAVGGHSFPVVVADWLPRVGATVWVAAAVAAALAAAGVIFVARWAPQRRAMSESPSPARR